jgi:biopolymer transport protein ExbB/TolQ
MNISLVASLISVTAVVITGLGTVMTSINAKRSRSERETEREVQIAQRDKLKEEASEIAMRKMGAELDRVRKELESAYDDLEEARQIRRQLESRVDEQDGVIRSQTRRLRTLEDWIEQHAPLLGIDGLPPDIDHDRNKRRRDDPGGSL